MTGVDDDLDPIGPARPDFVEALVAWRPPAELRRIHDLKQDIASVCDRLFNRAENPCIAVGVRAEAAGLIERRQRDACDGMHQAGNGLSLLNPISVRGRDAEMMPARGIRGSASGLIGGHNDRRQHGAEQRSREQQRLQLRVGARRRENDLDPGFGQSETGLQFVAHRLDAGIERGIDADGNGGLHQRLPRIIGTVVSPLRDRCRCA